MSNKEVNVADIFNSEENPQPVKKAFQEEKGRCWFCGKEDDVSNLDFSWEFDAFLHRSCLVEEIERDNEAKDKNPELVAFKREFGLDEK